MRTVYKHILRRTVFIVAVLMMSIGSVWSQGFRYNITTSVGDLTNTPPHTYTACGQGVVPNIAVALFGGSGNYSCALESIVDLEGGGALTEGTQYREIDLTSFGMGYSLLFMAMPAEKNYLFTIKATDNGTSAEMLIPVTIKITKAPEVVIETEDGLDGVVYGCKNKTIRLKDVKLDPKTYSYRWLLNNNDILTEVLSTYSVPSVDGRYSLVASATIDGCETTSNIIELHFNDVPEVSFTIPPVCDGEALELQATLTTATVGPYNYDWSGPGGYAATTTSSPATIPNAHDPANSGSYKVEVTDANGCKANADANITVSAPVDPGEISVDITSVCKGETKAITLSSTKAPTGGHNPSYQWQMQEEGGAWVDISGATDFNGWTGDITFNKTTKFRRVFFNACGDMESNEVTVTVVAPAVLDPGGPYPVCPGQTVTLQGDIVSGATQGVWSGGAGTWNAPTTLNGATYTPADSEYGTTVQLTLSTTDAGGECGQQSVTVDLVVAPEIKLTFDKTEVCVNDAPFIPSVAANVSGSGMLVTVDFDVTIPFDPAAYVGAGPKKFKYQYTAGGCMAEEEFTITVTNPKVFAITNTSPATYCASGSGVDIELDGSENGVTYTVYRDGMPTTHTLAGNGGVLVFFGIKGAGVYTIKAVDANGCEIFMTSSVTLTEVTDIAGNDIAADQTICSGSSATPLTGPEPTGGNGTYIYQWRSSTDGTSWTDISGANSQNYDPGKVSAKTYYQRYVTSGACDNTSAPVTISVTTPIQNNTIGADQTICYGAVPSKLTGEVATSSGGTVSYIWQVSTDGTSFTPAGGTERDFNPGIPLYADTWYRRVATDGGACPDDDKNLVKITVLEELKVSVTASTEPSCGNRNDGSLTATATGGKGSYTFFWKNNTDGTTYSGATINTATKGDYTVKVHEAGCATDASNTFTLNAPADVTGDADPTHITTCFGRQEGSIEIINVTGGDGNYTYSVKDSAHLSPIGNVFANLYGGDYTIIITDGKGCEGTAPATIDQPTKVEITNIIPNPPTCDGKDDGSITVEATGGTGALTYTLNGGTPTPVGTATTGLTAGTYNIVVIDVNNCKITGSETLADPDPVSLDPTPIPVAGCPGTPTGGIALSITGGTGPYEYYSDQLGSTWEPVTGNITGQPKGTYYIKVRDVNLCESAEKEVKIEEPNALNFIATPNTVDCHNSTDGVIAITNITGGTGSGYWLYIKDHTLGNHDGTVSYEVTGNAHTFDGLAPDTYTITLFDGVCYSLPQDHTVGAPDPINISLVEKLDIQCWKQPLEGTVKFSVDDGGTGTLRYNITEPGNKSKIIKSGVINRNGSVSENLGVGLYDIVVIDENECESNIISDVEIVLGNRFRWKDGGVNVTYTDVTCAELNDGTASHEVVFGTGEYYYELIPHGVLGVTKRRIPDSGTTTAMSVTFINLPKGKYSLRAYSVGLPDDCPQETQSFTIGGPDSVKADIDKFDDIRCHGENATLTVSAKGGSGEYDIDLYSLSMGYETTIHVVGSDPAVFPLSREDEYYTTIKDTKGCGDYETKHYTVHNPQPVSFEAKNDGNVTCNGGDNGVILISGLGGGNGELWYSVNGGDGVYIDPPHSDFTINVGKGRYEIKVYDGNKCESPIEPIKTVIIDEPKPLWIHSHFNNPYCSTTGDLKVEARGGNGTGTYEFSENGVDGWLPQDAFVWNNIGGGGYKIWLRDAFDHNCMIPWDTTVITPTALQIVKDLTIDVVPTCRQKGVLSVETEGGMSTVKYYLWREGETDYDQDNETGIFEVKLGGDYYVKIDDGCPPSPYTTGKVHIDDVPKVNIVNIHFDDIRCNGETTTVTVTADGSPTGKYFYTLLDKSVDPAVERSNGENNVFDDVKAGLSYYIVVADSEDGSGCVDTVPFAVDEAETFMWSHIRAVPETSSGDANGYIHFKTKGGEYDYTVTFTPEGGSPTSYQVNDSTYLNVFDNLGSGVYTVKVKDNRGCPLDSTFILQGIDIEYWMEHVSCNEKADGKVVAVVTGNPPYSLYLQDGNNPMITYTDYEIYSKSIINKELTGYKDTLIFSNIPAGDYDLYVGDKKSIVPISRNAPILLPTLFEASKLDADVVPVCAMGGTGKVSFEVKGSNTLDAGGNEVKNHEGIIIRPTYVIKWVNTTTDESGQKESTTPGTITVDGLNPGVIEFIATTENGCNETLFTVDFPLINPITVDVSVMQESSYDAGNGLIEANVTSGGVPDFEYVLHTVGGGSTAPSPIGLFSNVARGKYVVEARDANCSGFSDTIEIRGTNFVIDSTHSVSCYGGSTGEFWFTLGFGFKPFEVKVTNSANETVTVAELLADSTYYVKDVAAGEYTITVEDSLSRVNKGEGLTYTVVVDEAKEMILDVLVLASKCELGEAEYDFNGGGTPDYTYLYSMDATASYDAYTALAPGETKYAFEKAGEYYFVVKDANGCYSNKVTHGATQADIDFTIGVTDNHCPGGQNGVITVAISNIDNYSFSLYQGGSMINVSENGLFENLLADGGNFYGIEVTDKATLCSVRTPDTIRVNDGPAINLTVVGFSDDGSTLNCSYDTNGWIEAEATGGNGEFTYIWPDLGESTQRVDGLPAGDYTVIAVDSRDCPQSKTYTINGPDPFTFNPSVRVEAQCRKSTNASGLGGELHVSGSGASEPYTFTLVDETGHAATPSNNTGHFTGLGAGIYEVVVVDKKNCRYTMYDEILINPANDFDIGSMDTTVCFTNEVELKANMIFGDVYNDQYGLKYSWWSEANEGNITPDATGETYYVEGLDVNIYRYKLRVSQEGGPLCYVEKWFDVGVYPKLDIHVPLYVSTVQNDTILSILFNEEYNVDVSANNFDYNTQFEWFPKGVFVRENSWNTSIFMTPEKYAELKETYPNRFVIRRDPQTKRDGEFMLATVVGTTDVGCKDSLTLYTKIVNKLYLANVFSPNGDGRNDIWRIPKEYLFPDLEIEIFNRWGALVWSATGDRAARGWDGRSNNGKHLPIGTYWYVIKFNINSDDWKPLTGSVTIVK